MFHPSPYVSIRDDANLRSLSQNERTFTRECALASNRKSLRVDGRTSDEVRPVRLHLSRWDFGSECTVQWGSTRVTALCTAELVRPNLDRPAEGKLDISVDLSPAASPAFRQAPPFTTGLGPSASAVPNFSDQNQRLLSNRILRCLERIILVGGALDTEALCLVPAQWVWRFQLALTVLDDGGNIMDAAVLAAMASLRHYRKPQVEMDGNKDEGETAASTSSQDTSKPVLIPSHLREPTPLPLHHTPLAVSFAFIPFEDGRINSNSSSSANMVSSSSGTVAALIDPTNREELLQNGALTVGMNVHLEVCLLDYGGGCELPPTQLKDCWRKAESSIRQLCAMLEKSLEEADQQAQKDRLQKLQQKQRLDQAAMNQAPALPPGSNVPFFQGVEPMEVEGGEDKEDGDKVRQIQTEAEEAYRRDALDFKQGYRATKVREDNDHMRHSSQPYFNQAGALLKAMLKSAQSSTTGGETRTETKPPPDNTGKAKANKTPPKSKTKTKESVPMEDSDEEEAPQILQSEFSTSTKPPSQSAATNRESRGEDDDEDIDDLAMAVISKKKKKKKSKK